ncbi:MFS transporter [Kocuria sp. CPCC 205292]|uniref:MFS transporter n=1 Tax=Kocuria cellulosilytica TaxID=3071451 RepID=UPI0034D6DE17
MATDAAVTSGEIHNPRNRIPEPVLGAVGFLSLFDRFGTAPMLLVLADRTPLSLGQAVQLIAVYALFCSVGQPVWELLSDRFGRLTVLRMALVGGVVGGVASALFSAWLPLLLARAFTGLMIGALYPTLLTLLGDSHTGVERARSLSALQIYASLGTTVATLTAGTIAALLDWRLVFGLTALGCLALLWALRGAATDPAEQPSTVFRHAISPSALGVYGLAVLMGAVLMGVLAYVVPALQHAGVGVGIAGMLAATYGVGVISGAHLMRRLVRRFSRTGLMATGGTVLVCAYAVSSTVLAPVTLTVTALLIGVSSAVLNVSVQGWATEVAPRARATSVSLFACSLFLGSSLSTFLTADLAQQGRYGLIFTLALLTSIALTVAAALGHARWTRRPGHGRRRPTSRDHSLHFRRPAHDPPRTQPVAPRTTSR